MSILGNNLKHMRKKLNYSQIEMAKLIGVSQTSIAHYEKGTRQPSLESLIDFSQLFDQSIDSLVGNSSLKQDYTNKLELEYVTLRDQMVTSLLNKEEQVFKKLIKDSVLPYYDLLNMVDKVFKDVMYIIGDKWEQGEISEADEHYASNLVRKSLHEISPLFEETLKSKKAISMTVGSEKHTLGIEMVNACLEAEGIESLYLGSNLPIRSVDKAIKDNKVDYLFLSITMKESMNSLIHLVTYIKEKYKEDVIIGIGGQGVVEEVKELKNDNIYILKNMEELLSLLHV